MTAPSCRTHPGEAPSGFCARCGDIVCAKCGPTGWCEGCLARPDLASTRLSRAALKVTVVTLVFVGGFLILQTLLFGYFTGSPDALGLWNLAWALLVLVNAIKLAQKRPGSLRWASNVLGFSAVINAVRLPGNMENPVSLALLLGFSVVNAVGWVFARLARPEFEESAPPPAR